MAENKSRTNRQLKRQVRNSFDHTRIPRPPKKPERGENIFYICSKTNIKAQLVRCNKLLNDRETEIVIYCMGAAIQRGILLALQILEQNITYKIHTNTFTTELIDDLEPVVDDADYDIQRRLNSALRIRIFNSNPIEASKP